MADNFISGKSRNAKGRFLSGPAAEALNRRVEANTYGQGEDEKDVEAIKLASGGENRGVQAYLQPAFDLVSKALGGPAGELAGVIPVLEDIKKKADSDITLWDDKLGAKGGTAVKHINKYIDQLIEVVKRKTQLQMSIGAKLKGVARRKLGAMNEALPDKLQNSGSMIFRTAGRALARRREKEEDSGIGQEIAEAKAKTAELYLERQNRKSDGGGGGRDDDEDWSWGFGGEEEGGKKKKGASRVRRMSASEEGGVGAGPSTKAGLPVFKRILTTDQAILVAAKQTNVLLQKDITQASDLAEAAEKDRERGEGDGGAGAALGLLAAATPEGAAVEAVTGGGLSDIIKNLFGGNKLTGIVTALGSAFSVLGTGALIIGAAFAGWKIGQMIDKWTGASNYVQAAAEWFGKKLGFGGFGEADKQAADAVKRKMDDASKLAGEVFTDPGKAQAFRDQNDANRKEGADYWQRSGDGRKLIKGAGAPESAKSVSPDGTLASTTGTVNAGPTALGSSHGPSPVKTRSQRSLGGSEMAATGTTNVGAKMRSNSPERQRGEPASTSTNDGSKFDYDAYAKSIAGRESAGGGDYRAFNQLGYVGKYQFGLGALEDTGFIKKGTYKSRKQSRKSVQDPNIWVRPGGLETFFADTDGQEAAMRKYTEQNRRQLRRQKTIGPSTAPDEEAGWLGASHLIGAGGVYTKGLSGTDANSTTAASYYETASQGQRAAMTASTAPAMGGGQPTPGRSAPRVASATLDASRGTAPPVIMATMNNVAGGNRQNTPVVRNAINPDNSRLRGVTGFAGTVVGN